MEQPRANTTKKRQSVEVEVEYSLNRFFVNIPDVDDDDPFDTGRYYGAQIRLEPDGKVGIFVDLPGKSTDSAKMDFVDFAKEMAALIQKYKTQK